MGQDAWQNLFVFLGLPDVLAASGKNEGSPRGCQNEEILPELVGVATVCPKASRHSRRSAELEKERRSTPRFAKRVPAYMWNEREAQGGSATDFCFPRYFSEPGFSTRFPGVLSPREVSWLDKFLSYALTSLRYAVWAAVMRGSPGGFASFMRRHEENICRGETS